VGSPGVVGRQIVDEDDVERIDAQPLQAVLDRAPDPVRGIVRRTTVFGDGVKGK